MKSAAHIAVPELRKSCLSHNTIKVLNRSRCLNNTPVLDGMVFVSINV
jgi:hypothetical protein